MEEEMITREYMEKFRKGEWVPYRTAITLFNNLEAAAARIKQLEAWQAKHVKDMKPEYVVRREGNRIIVEPK